MRFRRIRYQLIGFRVVQGIGGGGLVSASMAITGEIIPPRERGRYTGYFAVVAAAATLLGPLVGGVLVDRLSWRSVFYVNLPIGLAALVLVNRTVPTPARGDVPPSTGRVPHCSSLRPGYC